MTKRKRTVVARRDDKNDAAARRRLIKGAAIGGLAAGASLPARWSRPVVDRVFLPAHAQTSTTDTVDNSVNPTRGTVATFNGTFAANESILDYFVTPALARDSEQICGLPEADKCCFSLFGGTDGTYEFRWYGTYGLIGEHDLDVTVTGNVAGGVLQEKQFTFQNPNGSLLTLMLSGTTDGAGHASGDITVVNPAEGEACSTSSWVSDTPGDCAA